MKMVRTGAVALMAVACAAPALAQDAPSGFTAAVSAGTLGVGPELGYRVSDSFGVRGSATFLGFGADFNSDDIDYDGKLKLKSYGLMADVYPMGGHFRVSAGARINKNRARVTAAPTTSVEVGGTTYTPAQIGTLRGRAEVKEFAPALTLGWSGSNATGFMFGFDAGVLFQGKVKIRQFTSTGTLASNAAFLANLETERRDLQDDVDDYKVYPIAQFTVGWRF